MNEWIRRVGCAIRTRVSIGTSLAKYMICSLTPTFGKKRVWVICERGNDARDNGLHFYKYMKAQHPEIKVKYMITPDSPDFERVAEDAITTGSWRGYWTVAKAEKVISTHCYKGVPGVTEEIWRHLNISDRFYFLQHGVIQSFFPYLFGDRAKMKLFCCGAEPEFKYVRDNFRHPEGVVQYTGLARYDALMDFQTKRQILIMPTWRRWLKNDKIFQESEYFHAWQSVLLDERITKKLQEARMELIFYPHYEMQPYIRQFRSESDRVIIADIEHYDVQQLLKESMVLITDRSSVYFDFAYMSKPVIYYHFDTERYFQEHYRQGYFDFDKDGFGPVVETKDALVEKLTAIIDRECAIDDKYRERIARFFTYRDQNNCERIYQAIISR